MKTIKRMVVTVIAFVMIVSMFSCVSFTASAAGETNWALSFAKLNGDNFETVTSVEPGETFYIAVGVNDFSAIGEMTVAKDEYDAIDYAATAYGNTIAAATVILDCSALATIDTTAITTPYTTATVETNYANNQLRVIMWADKASGGLDYSIGNAELTANNGVLFYVKAVAGEEIGSASYTFNAGDSNAAASIATINKAAETQFNSLQHVSSVDLGGYDASYALSIENAEPVGPTYVETLTIPNKNVKFESDYTLGLYVSTSVFNSYKTVYIKAEKACFDGNTPIDPEVVTLTKAIDYNASLKVFEYAGFAAKEMSSVVKATVWAVDEAGNEYYGPEIEYSLRDYAQNQIGKTTKPLFKTMMVDFLNYGAAAQTYFSYNTNDLANANIAEHQDVATPERTYVDSKAGTEETSYAIDFTNFNLEYVNKINIAVVTKTSISDEKLAEMKESWYAIASYTDFNGVAQSVRLDLSNEANFGKVSGYWAVMFNGLASKEMSTPVTVTLYDGEGVQQSNSATYSIETYAAGKVNGTNVKLANLAKSMMKFGDGAAAYFA